MGYDRHAPTRNVFLRRAARNLVSSARNRNFAGRTVAHVSFSGTNGWQKDGAQSMTEQPAIESLESISVSPNFVSNKQLGRVRSLHGCRR